MYLEKLLSIAPGNRVKNYTVKEWAEVEAKLGIQYPSDFKGFANAYQFGHWFEYIYVLNPFDPGTYTIVHRVADMQYGHNYLRNNFPEDLPHPFYPEKGGVFPIVQSDGGQIFYEMNSENSDEWTLVYYYEDCYVESFQMGFTEFMYKLLTKEIKCAILSDIDVESEPKFIPLPWDIGE